MLTKNSGTWTHRHSHKHQQTFQRLYFRPLTLTVLYWWDLTAVSCRLKCNRWDCVVMFRLRIRVRCISYLSHFCVSWNSVSGTGVFRCENLMSAEQLWNLSSHFFMNIIFTLVWQKAARLSWMISFSHQENHLVDPQGHHLWEKKHTWQHLSMSSHQFLHHCWAIIILLFNKKLENLATTCFPWKFITCFKTR